MSQRVLYVGGFRTAGSITNVGTSSEPMALWPGVSLVRYKHSESAGYGFVELLSGEQALRAIASLNGASFHGNSLRLFVMS